MIENYESLLPQPSVLKKIQYRLAGNWESMRFLKILRLFNSFDPSRYFIVASIGLFYFPYASGEQKELQFKHLTTYDGLSSSVVTDIVQDYKGFMWFGTYEGLNRYDGANIAVYKNSPSDPSSLLSNHIRAVFEDHDKNLFIGTWSGLSVYDRGLDCFKNYRFDKSSALYNMDKAVIRIAEDSIGNFWLATDSGLVYFDRKNNKINQYRHDPAKSGTISNSYIECVYVDKSGRIWVATKKGLNHCIPTTGCFEHVTHCYTHNDNIADIFLLDIIEDKEGNIWFGSADGLFLLENNPIKKKIQLSHFQNNPADPNSLSNNRAKSLFVDDEGKLWVGTENGGVNLYDRNKRNFIHYRINEFNPMSLNNESIHAIAHDVNKNLWLGTFGGGVNLSIKNSDFIVHYKNLPGAQQSLSYNVVSCFMEDRLNQIWVGTDGGGFNLFNAKTGRFIRFDADNSKLNNNAILCMEEGADSRIWLGTWEGGLVEYNYAANTFKFFTTQNSGIPDNSIYSMAKDEMGNLWLGSFGHGLINYQIKENKFYAHTIENSGISNNLISLVKMGNNGQVYLGSTSGFQIFIPSEDRYSTYENNPVNTNSLSDNSVNDILIQNDTCTWIATQNGLNRFNPVSGIFRKYFKEDGLPNSIIKGLTLDKSGMLWLTTNSGICRFDYRSNIFKHFTISDGLQSNEFYKRSILTTKNGSVLAGGTNGFNLLHPDRYSENGSIPPVVFTDFQIFNEKVKIGVKGSPLKKQISETTTLTLSYKQSVLTFYFAVLDFANPKKNQYAYKMENFDKDWIYCGNRQDATYTSLNPGKYRFHVKGSNNDGIWNETGTTLELIITPPWWETRVARAVFVMLIILLLLGIYSYFRSKQQQKHLREIVASQKKIEDIMHSIDEAIFTINEDMSINPEHSKTAEKIFGITEFEKQNPAALFHLDEKTAMSFAKWLKLSFRQPCSPAGWEKAMRFIPIKEVMLERESRVYLSVNCRPIYENNGLSRVMVIVNDITLRKEAEAHLAQVNTEKGLLLERVFGIVNHDQESVVAILELGASIIGSFEALNFDVAQECLPRLQSLGRDLHTLKGNAGTIEFTQVSRCSNELESALEPYTLEKNRSNPKLREWIDTAFCALKREISAVDTLRKELYKGKEDKFSVDKAYYAKFLADMKQGRLQSLDEIIRYLSLLNSLTFSEFCVEFSAMATNYSAQFQKNIEPLSIETPNIRLERSVCKVLKGPVTHLVRNALDHGIEENAVRKKSGKSPGRISMAVRETDDRIEVEIADNGRGIDPERVAASAVKKGYLTLEQAQALTDTQKQDLIFLHGFSTMDAATDISGRGMGMDAVKTDIEKAGGGMKLTSTVGQGTRMLLWVPK
jgi:ligand-binding sensor domain-containing protein/HPt (histidine-containing phosphotransfer) domain-containing protein/two-component sensor histidine kinase/PAS domain-containing protein